MFKAVLSEAKLLKYSIDAVSNLINEGSFQLSKDGIELIAMDSANVAMVEFKISSSAFKKYEIDKETSIGINMDDLTSIMKRIDASDELELTLTDRLEFKVAGSRNFAIPVLDVDKGETKIPQLQFLAKLELDTNALNQGIDDAEVVSDAITLIADEKAFYIKAEGDGRAADIKIDKDALLKKDVKEEVKSVFPIDYLKKMMKTSKISEHVTMQLGNDYPMRLDFSVPDKLRIGFILAPRIENK